MYVLTPGHSLAAARLVFTPTDAPTQDVDMVFPTESMIQLSQELQAAGGDDRVGDTMFGCLSIYYMHMIHMPYVFFRNAML